MIPGMIKNMKRRLLMTLLALLMGLPAFAQEQPKVRVSAVLNTSALRPGDRAVAAIIFDIDKRFHTQSHQPTEDNVPTIVTVRPAADIEYGEPVYPPGELKEYPALGKLSVYSGRAVVYVPVKVKGDAALGPVKIAGTVSYQACDDKQCYFPEETAFAIDTKVVPAGEAVQAIQPELFKGYDPNARPATQPATPTTPPVQLGSSRQVDWSIGWAFTVAFLAGLIFNVMPCVLPVLPLKAIGFFEVAQHDRAKCIALGGVFSLGVILFFAALAIPILALKAFTWGEPFSNPWVVWPIVGILVLMAAGMFGLFNLNLPTGVYNFTPRHDTFGGNLVFGMFTALLATPCTAPMLPPLMLWAAAQPLYLGLPAMMMVGVGMATPYFILSAFPGLARRMPRTGPWSELVKQMMAFLLLVAAAYFAGGRLIHGPGFWWLVLAVVAVACIFLIGRTVQFSKSAAGLAVATILAVGLFAGALYQTVQATGILRTGGGTERTWTAFAPEALEQAQKENRIALVKFTANWCATCQVIESTVFAEGRTWQALRDANVVTLKADMTNANPPAKSLLTKLNPTGGIPLTAIYSPKWSEPVVLESLYTTETLLKAIEAAR